MIKATRSATHHKTIVCAILSCLYLKLQFDIRTVSHHAVMKTGPVSVCKVMALLILMSIRHILLQLDDNQPLFCLKEKCLLWDSDLNPSPSKVCVLTIKLTHATQRLGPQVKVNQRS